VLRKRQDLRPNNHSPSGHRTAGFTSGPSSHYCIKANYLLPYTIIIHAPDNRSIYAVSALSPGRSTAVAGGSLAVLLLAGVTAWPALRRALLLLAGVAAWATGAALRRVSAGLLGWLAVLAWRRSAVLALALGRSTVLALAWRGSAVLALRRAILALRGAAELAAGSAVAAGGWVRLLVLRVVAAVDGAEEELHDPEVGGQVDGGVGAAHFVLLVFEVCGGALARALRKKS
jgi:hypothetical protein